jgi:hypothetical protein
MFYGLVNLFDAMSLAEELHTICFTVFVVVGGLCCFLRSDLPPRSGPTMSGPDSPTPA